MSSNVNVVSITGNLTRDAEHRASRNGTEIATFTVAVNEQIRNAQTGIWEDHPNFVDCMMFGTRAGVLANHLLKGTKVAIQGKLRYSSWQDKNNARHAKLEVMVDEIDFMSTRPANEPQPPVYPIADATGSASASSSSYDYGSVELADQDIAF